MPYLKTDTYSFCDHKKLYGRAGEEVTIIRRREHVLIVQLNSGFRFSMLEENLVDDPDGSAPAAAVERQQVPAKKGSRKSAPPPSQNSLFNI